MNKKIKDFEGNPLEIGDIVTILTNINENDIEKSIESIKVGEIVNLKKSTVDVKTDNDISSYTYNKISKLKSGESVDDMIIRIANNLEVLQLMEESNIIDSMLQSDDDEEMEEN